MKQEIDLLRNYLELLKIRMGDRLQFAFDIEGDLQSASLPLMLLQPIVDNAIKHGLEPKAEGGRVRIAARRAGDSMVLTVADNGLGFSDHADSSGARVGLANLRERLAVRFDGQATLTVADAAPGTVITITAPVASANVGRAMPALQNYRARTQASAATHGSRLIFFRERGARGHAF